MTSSPPDDLSLQKPTEKAPSFDPTSGLQPTSDLLELAANLWKKPGPRPLQVSPLQTNVHTGHKSTTRKSTPPKTSFWFSSSFLDSESDSSTTWRSLHLMALIKELGFAFAFALAAPAFAFGSAFAFGASFGLAACRLVRSHVWRLGC